MLLRGRPLRVEFLLLTAQIGLFPLASIIELAERRLRGIKPGTIGRWLSDRFCLRFRHRLLRRRLLGAGRGLRQIRDLRQAGRLERVGIVRSHSAPQQKSRGAPRRRRLPPRLSRAWRAPSQTGCGAFPTRAVPPLGSARPGSCQRSQTVPGIPLAFASASSARLSNAPVEVCRCRQSARLGFTLSHGRRAPPKSPRSGCRRSRRGRSAALAPRQTISASPAIQST